MQDLLHKEQNLSQYREVIHDVILGLQKILGNRLLSVYGCGSWIRGETRPDSDIDFFFIIDSFLLDKEKKALNDLQKSIQLKWSGSSSIDIDIRYVNKSDESNFFTIAHKEIIQIDGLLLYGTRCGWDVYKDYSITQIVEAFNKIALYIYKNLLSLHNLNNHIKRRSRRSLSKTVIRTLEWQAVLKGAPISHSIETYIDHTKKYTPQLLDLMEKSMAIYRKTEITDADVDFLEKTLKIILLEAA